MVAGTLSVNNQCDFDTYGNNFGFAEDTNSERLYSDEMTDCITVRRYLRARYYDPATSRFNRLDPFAGNTNDPQSLHKYLYAHDNPVMGFDPTGRFSIVEFLTTKYVKKTLRWTFILALGHTAAQVVLHGLVRGQTDSPTIAQMNKINNAHFVILDNLVGVRYNLNSGESFTVNSSYVSFSDYLTIDDLTDTWPPIPRSEFFAYTPNTAYLTPIILGNFPGTNRFNTYDAFNLSDEGLAIIILHEQYHRVEQNQIARGMSGNEDDPWESSVLIAIDLGFHAIATGPNATIDDQRLDDILTAEAARAGIPYP